jgi:hypothetical protein
MHHNWSLLRGRICASCRRRLDLLAAQRSPGHPLALFRIGLAGVLLIQTASLSGHFDDLYGRHGFVDWEVMADGQGTDLPNLAIFEQIVTTVGLPQSYVLPAFFSLYLAALFCLMVGYRTRISASVAVAAHAALTASAQWSMYGVDQFAQIGLFYCLVLNVGHSLSLDSAAGRVSAAPSFGNWLALKVLQIHICIAYVASGIEKGLGEQWWNGEAVWRAAMSVHDPRFNYSFVATVPGLAVAACWMTLFLEAGAIAFVWRPLPRRLWLIGITLMHLGIAALMNLWAFSAVMIVFDVAAFGFPPAHLPVRVGDPTANAEGVHELEPPVPSASTAIGRENVQDSCLALH